MTVCMLSCTTVTGAMSVTAVLLTKGPAGPAAAAAPFVTSMKNTVALSGKSLLTSAMAAHNACAVPWKNSFTVPLLPKRIMSTSAPNPAQASLFPRKN